MMNALCFSALLLTGGLLVADACPAQAAQVASGITAPRVSASPEAIRTYRDEVVLLGSQLRSIDRKVIPSEWVPKLDDLLILSQLIAATPIGDTALPALLLRFQSLYSNLRAEGSSSAQFAVARAALTSLDVRAARAPNPFPFTLSTKTVFSVGVSRQLGGNRPLSVDLASNLIGTTFGAAVGAIGGGDALKGFIEQNFAFGLSLPPRSGSAVSTGYSIGLGNVTIANRTFFPVLAFQQSDTTAGMVPEAVMTTDLTRATWSAPSLGVGFTWFSKDAIAKRIEAGKPVPILSLSMQLPYYFPGGPTDAFGALFSGGNNKFVGASKPAFSVAFSLPLTRTDGVAR